MSKVAVRITHADNGKRMSLADFEHAESENGQLFELSRGVVTLMDVPNWPHFPPLCSIRRIIYGYDAKYPGRLQSILPGGECKILVDEFESERHPDLALYLTPAPRRADASIWREWIPEIVIEVVSFGSGLRDYVEKPDEYLTIGVKEYWVFDIDKQEMHVFRRYRGRRTEKVLRPGDVYTTRLLPGFELPCADVLQAAQ